MDKPPSGDTDGTPVACGKSIRVLRCEDRRALCERRGHCSEHLRTRPGVPLCRARAGVAEEVAQREAVDAFACEGACEGMALVVEAEAARDAGDGFRGFEVALD